MRQILCLSTSDYYPIPTRKQNVMNRLTDAQVIYVDPPVTLIAPFKDKAAKEKLHARFVDNPLPHISHYSPPAVLPFYNKNRFINAINQKRMAGYLAHLCRENGFGRDFTLWVYSPMYADVVAPLAAALGIEPASLWKHTVYDCVDRHSAYPGLIDPEVVDEMEEDLAAACGCVFTTAQGLYDRLSRLNDNCHLIPNGAAYELFSRTAEMEKEGASPHFGFVGMLQECIDYDIIRAVAESFPQGRVSLVGKSLPGVDLSSIRDLPNVELRGLVPQAELPGIIKDFDVCLNVFAQNDLSRDVSPLKFYEYLATGKPVVSTPVPLQVRDYADCVYVAEDKADFIEKCRLALKDTDPRRRAARMERARACSWDERVRMMIDILDR